MDVVKTTMQDNIQQMLSNEERLDQISQNAEGLNEQVSALGCGSANFWSARDEAGRQKYFRVSAMGTPVYLGLFSSFVAILPRKRCAVYSNSSTYCSKADVADVLRRS